MNDSKINKKFAVANGPVNRRLHAPVQPEPIKNSPNIQARLQAVKAKQRIGASLSEQLPGTLRPASKVRAMGKTEIMLAMACAVSAVSMLLGLIQGSILVGGLGCLFLVGFGLKAYLMAQANKKLDQEANPSVESVINTQDIAYLDSALEKLAGSASEETMAKLSQLKTLLLRCVALMAKPENRALVSSEDRFFVGECIRRYLPDSITAYLQIPEKDRSSVRIDQHKTAITLLHEQINMLAEQLTAKEISFIQLSGESLAQQQRFLSAKIKTGN